MQTTSFKDAGHLPTLVAAFLYFDLAFMVWNLLGPLGPTIAKELGLSPTQKALAVAVPVLSGALLRVVMGVLVDAIRPKKAGMVGQLIVMSALAFFWLVGVHSYAAVLALGAFLGVAGASFAVALPLASRWYPPQYQGTALGIAGAGNSGVVLASLFAPKLALLFGWTNVFGLALIPLVIVFMLYVLLARDAPNPPISKSLRQYLDMLALSDSWWFMFFYSVTFGGFVGLAASLSIYFNAQYGLDVVTAGFYTAACVFAGSMVRPLGGLLADRIGGIKSLSIMYLIAAAALATVSADLRSSYAALASFVIAMLALGMGNGAVFQLVPQRFRLEIGIMTGLVGMAGGIGGFGLASSMGVSKQITGHYEPAFIFFAALALIAVLSLTLIKGRWRQTWGAGAVI